MTDNLTFSSGQEIREEYTAHNSPVNRWWETKYQRRKDSENHGTNCQPYIRYFSNRRQAGEDIRIRTLQELRTTENFEVFSVPTSGCSTLHWYPQGREGLQHHSYYSMADINAFLFSFNTKD